MSCKFIFVLPVAFPQPDIDIEIKRACSTWFDEHASSSTTPRLWCTVHNHIMPEYESYILLQEEIATKQKKNMSTQKAVPEYTIAFADFNCGPCTNLKINISDLTKNSVYIKEGSENIVFTIPNKFRVVCHRGSKTLDPIKRKSLTHFPTVWKDGVMSTTQEFIQDLKKVIKGPFVVTDR